MTWVRSLLSCASPALPPQLVLLAKLIALAWIVTGHVLVVPGPFLPFWPWLDGLPPGLAQVLLQGVMWGACLHILLARDVPKAAFILGLTILIAVAWSRPWFSYNRMYTGLILVMVGLHGLGGTGALRPVWVQRQAGLVFCGAALDKLLQPDWRAGQVLASLLHDIAGRGALWAPGQAVDVPLAAGALDAVFRCAPWTACALSVGVIAGEMLVGIACILAWRRAAVAGIVVFEVATTAVTGSTMGMFFHAMSATTLAFVLWPAPGSVRFDPGRASHRGLRRVVGVLDADGQWLWRAGPGDLAVTQDGGMASGAQAARVVLQCLPALWLLTAFVLATPAFQPLLPALLAAVWLAIWRRK